MEAKPSFILKLQRADMLVVVGRELEIGWLPPLIQQSRNAKIQPGANGYLDASLQARILDIPAGADHEGDGRRAPARQPPLLAGSGKRQSDRPRRRRQAVRAPARTTKAYFDQRLADFTNRLTEAGKRWLSMMAPYKGVKVVTYHRSFTQLCRPVRPQRHRVRRAAAGNSADARSTRSIWSTR